MGSTATGQLLAVDADGQRYGLPARLVREVARLPRLTPLPNAPPEIMGLANVRGSVIPVLSLATLMKRSAGNERRLLVLAQDEPVALAVDGIGELFDPQETTKVAMELVDAPALIARTVASKHKRSRLLSRTHESAAAAIATDRLSLVTFAIGRQLFGLPANSVDEVLHYPSAIAVMPRSDAVVLGSFEVRGELLPLLSLPALLGLPAAATSRRSRVVVTRIGGHWIGLAVDAMEAIARVSDDDVDPVPIVLTRGDAEAVIQAICRIGDGRLVSVLAPAHLVRGDITAQLLLGGAAERSRSPNGPSQTWEQFLLFRVGEGEFGLPIKAIEEVANLPAKLARLPKSPDFVLGVMNLRGHAVPIIEQSRRFGTAAASGSKQRVLIVRAGEYRVGFLVDAASEVRRLAPSALHPAPELGVDETRVFERVVAGGVDAGIVLIVSPRELLDGVERDLVLDLAARGVAPS
ncbi:chemotaxis protein CheW [Sphingomonas sp. DBB INV C78]|uniref:chemotaxis protein CheW n=1 Tax=Sphingomonas sp. DBB INV C78 TaxID=3349434 RepID=UPI0036D3A7A4